MTLPFAQPLLRLRVDHPGAGIHLMETRLSQWYFQDAIQSLQKEQGIEEILFQALQLEADLVNLNTVLRFVKAPEERKTLRDWQNSDDLTLLFVGPGKLSFDLLTQVGNQDSLDAAVELLAGTTYESSLRAGLLSYASSSRLSDIEKQLRLFRLYRFSGFIRKDPLGIGVVIGYLALKLNEVSNIRWIAHGLNLGLDLKHNISELALAV
jgi:vacuolar-type H+-ATPase subunit C/Vma6